MFHPIALSGAIQVITLCLKSPTSPDPQDLSFIFEQYVCLFSLFSVHWLGISNCLSEIGDKGVVILSLTLSLFANKYVLMNSRDEVC